MVVVVEWVLLRLLLVASYLGVERNVEALVEELFFSLSLFRLIIGLEG